MSIQSFLVGGLACCLVGGCCSPLVEGRASGNVSENVIVRRLVDGPIIDASTNASIGENIQGPSLILAPDWAGPPLGKYYLYFADHKGSSIRLAYADDLKGPWTVYEPGALRLSQTGLPTEQLTVPEGWTPRHILTNFAPPGTPGIPDSADEATLPHIASPDVHVDADFRAFEHDGMTYALTMPGIMYRSVDGRSGFESGPMLFSLTQRHTAVLKRDDTLYVFWTRVGDAPERIYMSKIDISGDWSNWFVAETQEVLRPEREWEGAGLPVAPSYRSAINVPVNQLRDPAIFQEGGKTYLLYAVQGERGIGIAEVDVP